jgi:hypothetical protein
MANLAVANGHSSSSSGPERQGERLEFGAVRLRCDVGELTQVTVVIILQDARRSRFDWPSSRGPLDYFMAVKPDAGDQLLSCAIQAATLSPIMMHGKLVLARGIVGITEASATRN